MQAAAYGSFQLIHSSKQDTQQLTGHSSSQDALRIGYTSLFTRQINSQIDNVQQMDRFMDTYTGFVKTVLVQQLTGFSRRTATGCRPSVAYRTSGGSRIFERGYRFRWITAIACVVTLCQARRHYTSMQRLQSSQLFGMKCGNFWNLGSLKSHLLAFEALYNKHWSCAAVSAGPIPLPLYNMCSYVHLYQSYLVYFSQK